MSLDRENESKGTVSNEAIDEAAKKAEELFAKYDARLAKETKEAKGDPNKKNPYSFAIMAKSSADISHLEEKSLLLIKEPGKSWQIYYVNKENDKMVKHPLQFNDVPGLEKMLATSDLSPAALSDIAAGIARAVKRVAPVYTFLKPLDEFIDTEVRFQQYIKEFVQRARAIRQELDPARQAQFDSYVEPFNRLKNYFAEHPLENMESMTQIEKTKAYGEMIQAFISDPVFKSNYLAMRDIVASFPRFQAFLIEKDKADKQKLSVIEVDAKLHPAAQVNAKFIFLGTNGMQRFARYVMTLKEAMERGKNLENIPATQTIAEVFATIAPMAAELNTPTEKMLKVRLAAGKITTEINLLKSIDPEFKSQNLDQAMAELHATGKISDSLRERIKLDLLQLYTRVYVEHRSKGMLVTAKDKVLTALETSLFQIESALTTAGVKPLLAREKAEEMNAHGKGNREDFMFPLVAALPADDMKKVILYLYDEIKTAVSVDMPKATDKEAEKIRLKFANVFKSLQKMGQKGKEAWNEIVRSPTDDKGMKLGVLLYIPPKYVTDKISESHASDVFKQSAATLRKEFAPVTPPSDAESKLDSDSEDELAQPRVHEENTSILSRINQGKVSENSLKREIYGIVAEQVLNAHEQALGLSYDQVAIIYQFGESVAKEVLRESQGPAESKVMNINQTSATTMLEVFREALARAFVEASISLKEKQKESALPILREMAVTIDRSLQELAKNRHVDIHGLVPAVDIPKEQKSLSDPVDGAILGSIFPATEKDARVRTDIPRFVSEMVERIFEKANEIVKRTPATESDKRDFENVISTVMKMGVNFIREWNHKAGREFHELYIYGWGDDARLVKSFDTIAKLAATTTEDQRRDNTAQSVVKSFQKEMKDLPDDARKQALNAIMLAYKTPAADRDQLRLRFQSAIFDMFEKAYEKGRVRSALGVSKGTPYLEAVVNFIKNLDKELLVNGYRPLILENPANYPSDAVDCANLIFRQENKVLGKDFSSRIQNMFHEVVADFKLANQACGESKQIDGFLHKHDKTGPLYKAQEHFVNVMKAIQAMCGKEDNLNTNIRAKELWNQCLADARRELPQLGEFASLLTPVSLDKKVAIKEKNPKNEFVAVVQVAEIFRPLCKLFEVMKNKLGDDGLLVDYISNKKNKDNPFYKGRKDLVDAFKQLRNIDKEYASFARDAWIKLVEANAPRYGDALKKFLLMTDATEDVIKKGYAAFLQEVHDIPAAQKQAKLSVLTHAAVKESKEPSGTKESSLKSPRDKSFFAHPELRESKESTPRSSASKETSVEQPNPVPSPRPGTPSSSSSGNTG